MKQNYISIRYSLHNSDNQEVLIGVNGSSVHLHHWSIKNIELAEISNLPLLESLDLSHNHLQFLDLTPLRYCKKLKYINLNNNRLESLNLEPLENASDLIEIDLAMNSLRKLDLQPLSGKRNLRKVILSQNRLKIVDLYPLASCRKLCHLGLHSNNLNEVNLAPLLLCPDLDRIELSGNVDFEITINNDKTFSAILLDALLRNAWQYGNPKWVRGSRIINEIDVSHYDELIKKHGWEPVRDRIREALKKDTNLQPLGIQRKLFEKLGMPELFGLDLPIFDILKDLPHLIDMEKGMEDFYLSITQKIMTQLRRKGSTLFFDVERLSTTKGAIIVNDILKAREDEMNRLVLTHNNGRVDLWPLWMTGYGFKILRQLGIGRTTTKSHFHQIKKTFNKLGFHLIVKAKSDWDESITHPNLSPEMQELVKKSMHSRSVVFFN